MKKIVFATIPMQKIDAQHYVCSENKAIEYDGETRFPINAVLAKTLNKGDDVKVVRIDGLKLGMYCQRIDLESMNILKEVFSLNIKDYNLLSRNLEELNR